MLKILFTWVGKLKNAYKCHVSKHQALYFYFIREIPERKVTFGILRYILKSRDITWPTKVRLVKAIVFPVVMYGCESWTMKKAEHWKIDAFELWCWRRLLRVPWTARRSNQSILKEIGPGYSLEGMMLKLKLQYFGHLMQEGGVRWALPWTRDWGVLRVSEASPGVAGFFPQSSMSRPWGRARFPGGNRGVWGPRGRRVWASVSRTEQVKAAWPGVAHPGQRAREPA